MNAQSDQIKKQVVREKNRREQKNKAGYTATEVACGWERAIFVVFSPLGQAQ